MREARTVYLQKVKNENASHILHHIWELEAVSRIELVERTGLTSGTITNLTQSLIGMRIIKESEAVSDSVGRKRVNLRFDGSHYAIIGIFIARDVLSAIMCDWMGQPLAQVEHDIAGMSNPEQIIERIEPFVQNMLLLASEQKRTVVGIGLSIPGPMDITKGKLLNPPNFPGWQGFPIQSVLEGKFGIRVYMEDDARTSALAERWYGIGRTGRDLVYVTLGSGIGSGIIQNGKVLRGTNGLLGQVGQMSMRLADNNRDAGTDSAVCEKNRQGIGSPNYGCWEDLSSFKGILMRWGKQGSFEDFIAEVNRQEPYAASVMQETVRMLEAAIITMFNMYDPEVIVLGGKLYPYFAPYMEQAAANIRSRVYDFVQDRVFIEAATFGHLQELMGAVGLVFGKVMNDPMLLNERA